MSTNATPAAAPTFEEAQALLLNNVRIPVLFNKLAADHGIVPQNEAEAVAILKMATQLRIRWNQQQQQKAASTSTLIQRASQKLDQTFQQAGQPDQEIKQAAAQAAQVKEYHDAALVYSRALQA